MKTRNKQYLSSRKQTKSITKEEVYTHSDNKIDLDFPGFPHGQSQPQLINPKTKAQKRTAAVQVTDGEKKK